MGRLPLFGVQLFVLGFDGGALLGLNLFEQLQQPRRLERVQMMVGALAEVATRPADANDDQFRLECFHVPDHLSAGHVAKIGVHHHAINRREPLQGLQRLFAAVSRDDIQLRGLDNEFARGDTAGVLAIDNVLQNIARRAV